MLYYGRTDVGAVRNNNQDSFATKEYSPDMLLTVVCDGIGGAKGGSMASRTACDTFIFEFDKYMQTVCDKDGNFDSNANEIKEVLRDCAELANETVFAISKEDPSLRGMGTTLVASFICGRTIYTVNVGDSRMYLIRGGNIKQITRDHSYVQYLIDIGKITEDAARKSPNRNIITRAVGTENQLEADVFVTNVITENRGDGLSGTYILLCTDGLTNHLTSSDIVGIITEKYEDILSLGEELKKRVDKLIDSANDAGGSDNITAVLAAL